MISSLVLDHCRACDYRVNLKPKHQLLAAAAPPAIQGALEVPPWLRAAVGDNQQQVSPSASTEAADAALGLKGSPDTWCTLKYITNHRPGSNLPQMEQTPET